ncbi:cyclase family protein [Streptomyces sp. NPDC048179]|uniref:cyclase family protein n=1 Tax=Streptomyces sp. NPDC048179 TaxID=3365506 RepID=UPI0037114F6F
MSHTDTQRVTFAGRVYRLVDLSQRISNSTSAIEPMPHHIEYTDHRTKAKNMSYMLGEGVHWPHECAAATEVVKLGTHCGTHVDAPYHYWPESADGSEATTIDNVDLGWFAGDGFVLDMTHKKTGEGITDEDVVAGLDRIGYTVKPGDIALVRTDTSRRFTEPGYHNAHPGMRRSATEWLIDHGVRLMGIDAWGFDRPFDVMSREYQAGDVDQLWESHLLGREKPYCHIEKLDNLAALPVSHGFHVTAFPVKIDRASGAWTRVVAWIPEEDGK